MTAGDTFTTKGGMRVTTWAALLVVMIASGVAHGFVGPCEDSTHTVTDAGTPDFGPTNVTVELAAGDPEDVLFTISKTQFMLTDRTDLYLLFDTSREARYGAGTFHSAGSMPLTDLLNSILSVNPDVYFGLGQYNEKPIAGMGPADGKVFQHAVDPTASVAAIQTAFDNFAFQTALDHNPKRAALEAILQVAKRKTTLNFRGNSRPVILVISSRGFNVQGDYETLLFNPSPLIEYDGVPQSTVPTNDYDATLEFGCNLFGDKCKVAPYMETYPSPRHLECGFCGVTCTPAEERMEGTVVGLPGACEDYPDPAILRSILLSEGFEVFFKQTTDPDMNVVDVANQWNTWLASLAIPGQLIAHDADCEAELMSLLAAGVNTPVVGHDCPHITNVSVVESITDFTITVTFLNPIPDDSDDGPCELTVSNIAYADIVSETCALEHTESEVPSDAPTQSGAPTQTPSAAETASPSPPETASSSQSASQSPEQTPIFGGGPCSPCVIQLADNVTTQCLEVDAGDALTMDVCDAYPVQPPGMDAILFPQIEHFSGATGRGLIQLNVTHLSECLTPVESLAVTFGLRHPPPAIFRRGAPAEVFEACVRIDETPTALGDFAGIGAYTSFLDTFVCVDAVSLFTPPPMARRRNGGDPPTVGSLEELLLGSFNATQLAGFGTANFIKLVFRRASGIDDDRWALLDLQVNSCGSEPATEEITFVNQTFSVSEVPSQSPSQSSSQSRSFTPSQSPTPSQSSSSSQSPTPTHSSSQSRSATHSETPSQSPTPSQSSSQSASPEPTQSGIPSQSFTATPNITGAGVVDDDSTPEVIIAGVGFTTIFIAAACCGMFFGAARRRRRREDDATVGQTRSNAQYYGGGGGATTGASQPLLGGSAAPPVALGAGVQTSMNERFFQ